MDANIKLLRERVRELREERDALRDTRRSPTLGSGGGSNYRRRSVVENTAEQIKKLDWLLSAAEKELNETRRGILEKIAKQETAALRVLYFYRLYECLPWEQIADITGEEVDALRKRYRRNEEKQNK